MNNRNLLRGSVKFLFATSVHLLRIEIKIFASPSKDGVVKGSTERNVSSCYQLVQCDKI